MSAPQDVLARLNAVGDQEAEALLLDLCGSRRWVRAVATGRPYASAREIGAAAERAFATLARDDWEEALAAHPQLGDAAESGHQSARGARYSESEQAGVRGADGDLRAELALANRRYRSRFGRGYVVRAKGRTAEELLVLLEQRMTLDPEEELEVAAGEQRAITRLRIDRMLAE